jgi:uncharacterized membrane protein
MTLWGAVIVAALIAFALKLAGFLVPESVLSHPRARRVTAAIPVAMLAALVATQTLGGPDGTLVVDARVAAVGVAVVALLLRAPFIVVVVLGAVTAAAFAPSVGADTRPAPDRSSRREDAGGPPVVRRSGRSSGRCSPRTSTCRTCSPRDSCRTCRASRGWC